MQCAGHSWQLAVCPGAPDGEDKEYIAIYLLYRGSSQALRTEPSITLVNQLLGLRDESTTTLFCGSLSNGMHIFGQVTEAGVLFKLDLLHESKGFKVNDRVIVRVDITTYGDVEHKVTADDTWTPPETWRQDMASMPLKMATPT